jgi:hypothetical protein
MSIGNRGGGYATIASERSPVWSGSTLGDSRNSLCGCTGLIPGESVSTAVGCRSRGEALISVSTAACTKLPVH